MHTMVGARALWKDGERRNRLPERRSTGPGAAMLIWSTSAAEGAPSSAKLALSGICKIITYHAHFKTSLNTVCAYEVDEDQRRMQWHI